MGPLYCQPHPSLALSVRRRRSLPRALPLVLLRHAALDAAFPTLTLWSLADLSYYYYSMSSSDDKSREDSPSRGSRASSRGPSRASRHEPRPSRANVIEFVDSQDPNVKSAIQRHTAYHSAAQRRDARLRSLRRGNQSRYLEWGRRPGPEVMAPASPSSSASSLPPSSMASSHETEQAVVTYPTSAEILFRPSSEMQSLAITPSRGSTSSQTTTWTANEDALVDCMLISRHLSRLMTKCRLICGTDVGRMCQHPPSGRLFASLVASLRSDEATVSLLLAYCYAARAPTQADPIEGEDDYQAAHQHFGQGTNILWNRLRDPVIASSDVNIQAVLMLVVYTFDFGEANEVEIHADALRTMVRQRGGIDALRNNAILHQQLQMLDSSRTHHLTLACDNTCKRRLRFPEGFWAPSTEQRRPSGDDPES